MTALVRIFAAGLVAATLSACGLQGDLTRPDPLFGTPDPDIAPAEAPNRSTTDGLDDLEDQRPESDEDTPDADDELLGGTGGF